MGGLFRFLCGSRFRTLRRWRRRRFGSGLRCLSGRCRSDLQVVDDCFHARNGSSLLTGGIALGVVIDGTAECDNSIRSLNRKLLGGKSRILTKFCLDVAGDLGVIWLLGAAKFQRQKKCE